MVERGNPGFRKMVDSAGINEPHIESGLRFFPVYRVHKEPL